MLIFPRLDIRIRRGLGVARSASSAALGAGNGDGALEALGLNPPQELADAAGVPFELDGIACNLRIVLFIAMKLISMPRLGTPANIAICHGFRKCQLNTMNARNPPNISMAIGSEFKLIRALESAESRFHPHFGQ